MRACYAADRTGHMILQTLYQQCVKRDVRFFNEYYCLDLLRADDGSAAGVVAYELATGELHVFRAKSIVFATGGYGRMFRVTSNAHALTGDGPALVWRRGIPLEDMEMFQFHPTGLARLGVLLSEAARGEGGVVLNKDGERFMDPLRPHDQGPRAARHGRAARSTRRSRRGAAAVRNGDWSTSTCATSTRKVIEEKLPDITEFARVYLKVEPTKEPVPIQPTAHYAMGGIPTDTDGQVVIGPEEDDRARALRRRRVRVRLASTAPTAWARTPCSTSWCSAGAPAPMPRVTPRRHRSPHRADKPERRTLDMLDGILGRSAGDNGGDIRKELQDNMFDLAFVVRTEEGLCKMQDDPRRAPRALRPRRRSRTRARSTTPT